MPREITSAGSRMNIRILIPIIALFLALGNLVNATSFVQPKDQKIYSSNGQYVLHIKAKSGHHDVRKSKGGLLPFLRKHSWSFKREVRHDQYFVSNDGKYVLWVAWPFVQINSVQKPAIIIYSAKGEVLSRQYSDISKPRRYRRREVGPIGDFWRIWRGEVTSKGDVITIEVEGEESLKIDLSKPGQWKA